MDQATADKLRKAKYAQDNEDRRRGMQAVAEHAAVIDEASQRERRMLADDMVAALRRLIAAEFPDEATEATMVVHWDDCNFYCDQFWFHFRDRTLMTKRRTGDGHAVKMSRIIRKAMSRAKSGERFRKHPKYRFSWDLTEAPQAEDIRNGITRGRCYETSTWIYILNVIGS